VLPIEFARVSSDKRLTLVIHPGSADQRTYWALSEFEAVNKARENLGAREGTSLRHIHSVTIDGQEQGEIDRQVAAKIREWLSAQQNLHAAIWAGLPSNWERERQGKKFTPEDAVQYMSELERARDEAKVAYDRAHEYVSNAPPQIQTPVRKMIRERKGWKDAELPSILFET